MARLLLFDKLTRYASVFLHKNARTRATGFPERDSRKRPIDCDEALDDYAERRRPFRPAAAFAHIAGERPSTWTRTLHLADETCTVCQRFDEKDECGGDLPVMNARSYRGPLHAIGRDQLGRTFAKTIRIRVNMSTATLTVIGKMCLGTMVSDTFRMAAKLHFVAGTRSYKCKSV
jgi:hypothetical protein